MANCEITIGFISWFIIPLNIDISTISPTETVPLMLFSTRCLPRRVSEQKAPPSGSPKVIFPELVVEPVEPSEKYESVGMD